MWVEINSLLGSICIIFSAILFIVLVPYDILLAFICIIILNEFKIRDYK